MKVASFSVHATAEQSARWKQAAEADGHRSAGSWLAAAADAYLKVRARAGNPVPLAWRRFGRFAVQLDGETVTVPGCVSPPFGAYRHNGPGEPARSGTQFSLVYIPGARIVATVRTFQQCKGLASELARLWVRWGGSEPAEDPSPLLQRFERERA